MKSVHQALPRPPNVRHSAIVPSPSVASLVVASYLYISAGRYRAPRETGEIVEFSAPTG
jgi:hypothetical protein